jgi:ribonuclease E
MGSKMLVDATHPEETRVVVVRGNRIDEFDFESAARKQLKGNIYLAKVTRVEPSLQAAFVDYGGNRHGFLAFSEIHPDYYQIPIADRQALLRQEQDEARRSDEEFESAEVNGGSRSRPDRQRREEEHSEPADEAVSHAEPESSAEAAEAVEDDPGSPDIADVQPAEAAPEPVETAAASHGEEAPASVSSSVETVEEDAESRVVDSVGAEDALEEVPQRSRRPVRRHYKIQEVIKRRQVILVQVVKEERGNKGAALTTYLSLAGRYCVLMPNTARGGGISRKITEATDRRRLKEVAREVEVPDGMGLIVRTAGAQRTKTEIKRDFDYLMRLWESVRDLTLNSTAPALVYEEGDLIRRSIRDLYTKDVDEVLVEGDNAYRDAKDFMKMLMPSHARNVKPYKDSRPLFSRFGVESQLDSLFGQTVTLPSGGYMVINQTEALVSIDINSGKSTREHNIEDTAVRTNIEASDEIARQLRLRDLAGLIVIDFIDMEEKRNNRSVERRLKEALKHDRARIQVGHISHFGLLEMSRQRLRQGMLEGSTKTCPHCEGRGIVRSVSSCALSVLRSIEEQLIGRRPENLTVHCFREVASYILNEKRDHVLLLEQSYGISIYIVPSDTVKAAECVIERGAERAAPQRKPLTGPVKMETALVDEPQTEEVEEDEEEESEAPEEPASLESEPSTPRTGDDSEQGRGRRRRRRGRRGGRRNREGAPGGNGRGAPQGASHEADSDDDPAVSHAMNDDGDDDRTETDFEGSGPAEPAEDRASREVHGRVEDEAEEISSPRFNSVREEHSESVPEVPERDTGGDLDEAQPSPDSARKWTPPEPTVERSGTRRAGWWQKRGDD